MSCSVPVQILSTVHAIRLDTFLVGRKHHLSCSVPVQILSTVYPICNHAKISHCISACTFPSQILHTLHVYNYTPYLTVPACTNYTLHIYIFLVAGNNMDLHIDVVNINFLWSPWTFPLLIMIHEIPYTCTHSLEELQYY